MRINIFRLDPAMTFATHLTRFLDYASTEGLLASAKTVALGDGQQFNLHYMTIHNKAVNGKAELYLAGFFEDDVWMEERMQKPGFAAVLERCGNSYLLTYGRAWNVSTYMAIERQFGLVVVANSAEEREISEVVSECLTKTRSTLSQRVKKGAPLRDWMLDSAEFLRRLAAKTGEDKRSLEGADGLGMTLDNLEQGLLDALDAAQTKYADGRIKHQKLRELNFVAVVTDERITTWLDEKLTDQLLDEDDDVCIEWPAEWNEAEEVFLHWPPSKCPGKPQDVSKDERAALTILRQELRNDSSIAHRHLKAYARTSSSNTAKKTLWSCLETSVKDAATGTEYYRFENRWYTVAQKQAQAMRSKLQVFFNAGQELLGQTSAPLSFDNSHRDSNEKLSEAKYNAALASAMPGGRNADLPELRFDYESSKFEFADALWHYNGKNVWLHNKRGCGAGATAAVSEQVMNACFCLQDAGAHEQLKACYTSEPEPLPMPNSKHDHFGIGLIVPKSKLNPANLGIRAVLNLNRGLATLKEQGFNSFLLLIEDRSGQSQAAAIAA